MVFPKQVNNNSNEIDDAYKNDEYIGFQTQPQRRLALGLGLILGSLMLMSFVFTMILIGTKSSDDYVGYNWYVFGAGYGVTFFLLVAKGAFYTNFSDFVPEIMPRSLRIQSNALHGLLVYVLMTFGISCLMGHISEKILG